MLCYKLKDAHDGWDNFFTEVPIARDLFSYLTEGVPVDVIEKLVKIIVQCRVGNGVKYYNGVSPRGKSYYDDILKVLDDRQLFTCLHT